MDESTKDQSKRKVLIDKPLNWVNAGLNQSVKGIRFVCDDDGNMWANPSVIAGVTDDNADIQTAGIDYPDTDLIRPTEAGLMVRNFNYCFEPAGPYIGYDQWSRVRSPNQYWNSGTSVDDMVVVAAVPSIRHRILGLTIALGSPGLAVAAINRIAIYDDNGPRTLCNIAFWCTATATAAAQNMNTFYSFDFRPNGFLCQSVNSNIALDIATPLTSGGFSVTVWGTDEQ